MGRTKSAEKPKQKQRKGLWSPEEDQKLRSYILKHGHGCWSTLPFKAGLQRNGKSCRLRWINYLRPGLKRGMFSVEEEELVLAFHSSLGNKWSQIARRLPGRTDNEIKNYWHSHLKKRLLKSQEIETSTSDLTESSSVVSRNTETQMRNHMSFQKLPEDSSSQENNNNNNNNKIRTDQYSVPPRGLGFRQTNSNILPKLFFSEWFSSADPVGYYCSSTLADSKKNNIIIKHNPDLESYKESIIYNCRLDDQDIDMFSSLQLQYEDEVLENAFDGSNFNEFLMNSDVTYM